MMLDRPSAKAVNVLSDIIVYKLVSYYGDVTIANNIMVMSLSLHSAISAVPYLNNGTPLPLMIWHGQATSQCVYHTLYGVFITGETVLELNLQGLGIFEASSPQETSVMTIQVLNCTDAVAITGERCFESLHVLL